MDGGQEHTAPPDLHNSLRLLLPKTEWKQSDAGRVHNAYIDRWHRKGRREGEKGSGRGNSWQWRRLSGPVPRQAAAARKRPRVPHLRTGDPTEQPFTATFFIVTDVPEAQRGRDAKVNANAGASQGS
eukprot:GGOE01007755.1.p2 GENE.GGOE01007755.1~~GGOE01007755.1.p2  ORF type:complete len:127 (+),score=10.80 GGOE01007755.1:169-549(+)